MRFLAVRLPVRPALLWALLLLALWQAQPALAHILLLEASPAPGAEVRGTPDEIRLNFNEPLRPGSRIMLYDAAFREVQGVVLVTEETPETMLVARPPRLAPGVYTVQWIATGTDGHPQSGSYNFAVSASPRWPVFLLLFLMLLLVAGAIIRHRLHKDKK